MFCNKCLSTRVKAKLFNNSTKNVCANCFKANQKEKQKSEVSISGPMDSSTIPVEKEKDEKLPPIDVISKTLERFMVMNDIHFN